MRVTRGRSPRPLRRFYGWTQWLPEHREPSTARESTARRGRSRGRETGGRCGCCDGSAAQAAYRRADQRPFPPSIHCTSRAAPPDPRDATNTPILGRILAPRSPNALSTGIGPAQPAREAWTVRDLPVAHPPSRFPSRSAHGLYPLLPTEVWGVQPGESSTLRTGRMSPV